MEQPMQRPKDVHVDAYWRRRLGREEQVREHWRSHPRQYAFDFQAQRS